VVSCPCALSLATPAALTAAMTRLRQLGIVLTSSTALEKVPLIDRVFIDKTGTLTMDDPVIREIEVLNEAYDQDQCLAVAAALQRHSTHPVARAFASLPRAAGLATVHTVTGSGVEGTLDGMPVRMGSAAFVGVDGAQDNDVYLGVDGAPAARFVLSHRIRPDARHAVEALSARGITPMMMSGDSIERCRETAGALGVEFRARQTPEDKLEAIRREQSAGRRVLMLGDGINDIPVLAGADVSAAVVEASDLVKSRADVLLLNRRLYPLVDLIHIGGMTRRVIRQNLFWAALYNLIAIPIAALSLVPPWLAALGMASSSTLVMANAARLIRAGRVRRPADH
jgi:Cu2+-exporting ATPase